MNVNSLSDKKLWDHIWYPQNSDDLLEELIPKMPCLKELVVLGYRGGKIHSDSLESLTLQWSPNIEEIVCPSLQDFDTEIHPRGCHENWLEKYPPNLKTLSLTLALEDTPARMNEGFKVHQYVRKILERMTLLEHLIVSHRGYGEVVPVCDLFFKSKSLKILDIRECGKEFTVVECSCPQLRSFFVMYIIPIP